MLLCIVKRNSVLVIHESQMVKGADSGNGNRHQLKKIDFIIFLSS